MSQFLKTNLLIVCLYTLLVLFLWRTLTDALPFAKSNSGCHRVFRALLYCFLQKETSSIHSFSELQISQVGSAALTLNSRWRSCSIQKRLPDAGPASLAFSLGLQDIPVTQQCQGGSVKFGQRILPTCPMHTSSTSQKSLFDVSFLGSPVSLVEFSML